MHHNWHSLPHALQLKLLKSKFVSITLSMATHHRQEHFSPQFPVITFKVSQLVPVSQVDGHPPSVFDVDANLANWRLWKHNSHFGDWLYDVRCSSVDQNGTSDFEVTCSMSPVCSRTSKLRRNTRLMRSNDCTSWTEYAVLDRLNGSTYK